MTQTQHVQSVLAGALVLPLPRCILSDFSQRNATVLHLHAFTQTTQGTSVWSGYGVSVVDYILAVQRFTGLK